MHTNAQNFVKKIVRTIRHSGANVDKIPNVDSFGGCNPTFPHL